MSSLSGEKNINDNSIEKEPSEVKNVISPKTVIHDEKKSEGHQEETLNASPVKDDMISPNKSSTCDEAENPTVDAVSGDAENPTVIPPSGGEEVKVESMVKDLEELKMEEEKEMKTGEEGEGQGEESEEDEESKAKRVLFPEDMPTVTLNPKTGRMYNKMPRDWLKYSSIGDVVPGTPFLPFKTPLSEDRLMGKAECDRHTVGSLIDYCSERGLKLVVVVDLTLPHFYNPDALKQYGVEYVKIRIAQDEPKYWQVLKFLEVCDNFIADKAKRDAEWDAMQRERIENGEEPLKDTRMYEVIGVHCTRGVNRTGYMVCRAMIERMGYPSGIAMQVFGKARGHDMDEFHPELRKAEFRLKRLQAQQKENAMNAQRNNRQRNGQQQKMSPLKNSPIKGSPVKNSPVKNSPVKNSPKNSPYSSPKKEIAAGDQ